MYISHRLEELQSIVDRVTIMRDGQYITSMNFRDTTLDEIIATLGFAGLMGAGRTETTRAIFGIDAKESGQIFLDGREVAIHKPRMPYRRNRAGP